MLGTGTYTLTNTGNEIASLAANTGTLSVTNNHDFSLGSIVTTGNVELSSTGTVTQTGAITGGQNVNLLGTAGTYTLTNAANAMGTLTANTGSVKLVTSSGQSTGVINTTGALNLTSNTLAINGNIDAGAGNITLNTHILTVNSGTVKSSGALQIAAKSAGTTICIGGGTGTLQITATNFSTDFVDGFSEIMIGGENQSGNIDVDTTVLKDALTRQTTGSITQSGAITGDQNLTLLGGGAHTLNNVDNAIGQLTATSSTLAFRGESFTLGNIATTGAVQLSSTGTVTQASDTAITGDQALSLSGVGGTYTLNNTGNEISSLAANTGTLSVTNNHDFTLLSITTSGDVELSSTGTVTQTGAITGGQNVNLLGTGGTYTLTSASNSIGTLTANTGSVELVNSSAQTTGAITTTGALNLTANALTLGAINTGSTVTLSSTGAVTQTGAITGGQNVNLLGTGGTYTLTNASNAIGTLTANTGSVALVNSSAQTTGAITTTGALNLTSDSLTINENIATVAGNIPFNTDVLAVARGKMVAGEVAL